MYSTTTTRVSSRRLTTLKSRTPRGISRKLKRLVTERSEADIILLLEEVHVISLVTDELLHFIRVDVITATGIIFVARNIFCLGSQSAGACSAQDAGPLSVEQLTARGFTDAAIAEIRALEDMSLRALCTFAAVAVFAKVSAHGVSKRVLGVNIGTRIVVAFAFGKMHAERSTFLRALMGKITGLAVLAIVLQKPVATNSYFRRIMEEPTLGAFWTRT